MTKTTIIAKNKEHLEKLIEEAMQVDGHFCDLNYIDVSQVTDMSDLFMNSAFQGDISAWNVANVHNMSRMFFNSQFNGNIANWNVSKVLNMFAMFRWSNFNGHISKWDTSNVNNMIYMFEKSKFNGNITTWDVARVLDMFGMFQNSIFNGDISAWNVANVQDMMCMFYKSDFKGDLSTWSFHSDTTINDFFNFEALDQFEIPNRYHWMLLLNGVVTQKAQWREHVDVYAPIVRSLTNTENEAAMFMHQAWMNQELGCKTELAVPYEFREYS